MSGRSREQGAGGRERPILFNGEMVRAILDGSKTQTRRVVKRKDVLFSVSGKLDAPHLPFAGDTIGTDSPAEDGLCPFGVVGDRLWVRETWKTSRALDHLKPSSIACGAPVHYVADGGNNWPRCEPTLRDLSWLGKVRQSIFIPRWASRITLEITAVRVERLRNISDDDAKAEGMDPILGIDPCAYSMFATLWDSINGKPRENGVDISWGANPWVWVVEFKRVEGGEA